MPVPDGGGIRSTADWFQPRAKVDLLRDLRRKFESLAMEWCLVPRLLAHTSHPTDAALLSVEEVKRLRGELVGFFAVQRFSCNADIDPNQPFLLSVWRALSEMIADVDHIAPNSF